MKKKLRQGLFRCLLTALSIDHHAQNVVHILSRMQGAGYPLDDLEHVREDIAGIALRLEDIQALLKEIHTELELVRLGLGIKV
ncbi:MAG: hypothetical protein QXI19_02205 [Candidatus Caldarchaeum sp.]